MHKILLTSSGFTTELIEDLFLGLLDCHPCTAKILFIPAINEQFHLNISVKTCFDDLENIGIQKENISLYHLDYPISFMNLKQFDCVYFFGNDPELLVERIRKCKFLKSLIKFLNSGGIYVGVEAGSLAASVAGHGLRLINCELKLHSDSGSHMGIVDTTCCPTIRITDKQAIFIPELSETMCEVIE